MVTVLDLERVTGEETDWSDEQTVTIHLLSVQCTGLLHLYNSDTAPKLFGGRGEERRKETKLERKQKNSGSQRNLPWGQ